MEINNDSSEETVNNIKQHLEDGDKIVWYKDPSIVATWHTDGTVDLADKEHLAICSATFYASKGHWRDNATEHGVGKEPQHWMYNGFTIKDIQTVFKDFWEAIDKKDKQAKITNRKKKTGIEDSTNYESLKVEVADWEIETYEVFRKAFSTLKSIICYEVNYNIFEEYSVNALDKYINNNGVYIMVNGSEPYYVGQGDNVFSRVQMHLKDKHSGKWEKALLFVSKTNELTKDYQDVLEMRLIDETAGRGAKIVNRTIGNKVNAITVYSNNTMKYDSVIGFIAEASYKLGYDFLVRATYSNKTVNAIGNAQTELAKDESRTNVIVTPRWVVENMMNLLPEQAFGYGTTILDFAVKDGAFLQSAFERSFNNKDLITRFPDENRRKLYISQFKLFGVIQAATQDDYGIDLYAHLNGIIDKEHLIVVDYERELFDANRKLLKDKALGLLAKDIIKRFGDEKMKIDYVVGNPPYQLSTGGGKAGGTAIWPAFIDMSKSLNPEAIVMITPSRWFTGGQGITQKWRQDWMNDKHIDKLVHYQNANEVFPNTSIAGGVSYFRWVKTVNNYNENMIEFSMDNVTEIRQLNKFDVFIPDSCTNKIIEKINNFIQHNNLGRLESVMSSRREFEGTVDMLTKGADAYKKQRQQKLYSDDIEVICTQGIRFYDRPEKFKGNLGAYRVLTSYCTDSCSGNAPYSVLTEVFVTEPNQIHSQGYLHVTCKNNVEAQNIRDYIKTKTARFMLRTQAVGIHMSMHMYNILPILDFSRSYTDQELYKMFNLTQEEIDSIEKTIKPME